MTEFLIFLAMCTAFGAAFWWLLRRPTPEQRRKAQVAQEIAALRAKVAAEDAAKTQGLARKAPELEPKAFVPSPHHFPLETYGGRELRTPLGHDPARPDSPTIPEPFQGDWLWEGASADVAAHRIALRADTLVYHAALGAEPVVGTYRISDTEIAVVTQQMDDGTWTFATYLFQLLDAGARLTNLESMDMRWNRIR